MSTRPPLTADPPGGNAPSFGKGLTLFGAHRGGLQATLSLNEPHSSLPDRGPLPMSLPPLTVRVVDQEPGRAEANAALWARGGHLAQGVTGDALMVARNTPAGDMEILAVDSAAVQVQLLKSRRPGLLLLGLVVGTPQASGLGGRVAAYGAIVPAGDMKTREDALTLFGHIARLAGDQRATSRIIRDPFFNLPQVSIVRAALYQTLAAEGRRFLSGQAVSGRIIVTSAWPYPAAFTLALRERLAGVSRRSMRDEARNIARSASDGNATAFLGNGSICTVMPYGPETVMVDLPEPEAEQRLWAELQRRASEASARAVYTTD